MSRRGWVLEGMIAWAVLMAWSPQAIANSAALAYVGEPFGVGQLTVSLDRTEETLLVDTNGYQISERSGRVFYPAFAQRRSLGMLRQLLGVSSNKSVTSITCFFLFTGTESLELTVRTPSSQTVVVQPESSKSDRDQLLQRWWRQYSTVAQLRSRAGDYPPLLEKYLTGTLPRRLGLPYQKLDRRSAQPWSLAQESLLLMFNCEAMRLRCLEQTLKANAPTTGTSRLPLPEPIDWPDRQAPLKTAAPEIEPIARHVPEECYYVRFGSFPNFLWIDRRLREHGGDLRRMVTLRGHTLDMVARVERQLGLSKTPLTDLLGEKLISDMVILGRDAYVREGAAIGVLFEAKNELLRAELMKQRMQAVARKQQAEATMKQIQLQGRTISLAATPDNSLRSFYLVDGPYHLVTNSIAIAQRFLEAGQGQRSLADLPEFRQARGSFPVSDDSTLFAFASPAFLRGLATPRYQIELRRRLRAMTDLELVQLARLAARHEGRSCQSLDELQAEQLLPPAMQQRSDDSHVACAGERLYDSLRGARGSFLPIPDVPLQSITMEEADNWRRLVQFQQQRWRRMESVAAQIQRKPSEGQAHERVAIRAEVWPFDPQKYGSLVARLAPATHTFLRQSPDDVISLQLVVQRDRAISGTGPLHLCLGVQDREVSVQFAAQPILRGLQMLRTAPMYLGIWPAVELTDLMPLGQVPSRDDRGDARLPFGLWCRNTAEGFTVLAAHPSTLDGAAPELGVQQHEEAAQIRLRVADLSQSRLRGWLAKLSHQRAHQTSIGNTRLLNAFSQQLGTPVDQARSVAESVLDVRLMCALGGRYETEQVTNGGKFWRSTAWTDGDSTTATPAESFSFPLLSWLRGIEAHLTQHENHLVLNAELDIDTSEDDPAGSPLFDLFSPRTDSP